MPSRDVDADLERIHRQHQALKHGEKTTFLKAEADRLGVHWATLSGWLKDAFGQKRDVTRESKVPDDLVHQVALVKAQHRQLTKTSRQISTSAAMRILIDDGYEDAGTKLDPNGSIHDPDAYDLAWSTSTINRELRKRGHSDAKARTRWQADYAAQMWQIDGSRSKYFQIVRPIERDGEIVDWVCRVTDRELHYKDESTRLRTWIVQAVDDHSRARLFRYYAAAGESGTLWSQFMRFALQRGADDHPMRHVPERIYADNGSPMAAGSEFTALVDALGIETEASEAYNSAARGKVERGFRTIWQTFEAVVSTRYARNQGRKPMIRLSKINEMAHAFAQSQLQRPHPWTPTVTRGAVYRQSILRRSREVDAWPKTVDVDVLDLATRRWTRTVTAAREISIDGIVFEAPGYAAKQKVQAYRSVSGEWMAELLTGPRIGKVFRIEPYVPAALHEWERRQKNSYQETMDTEAKNSFRDLSAAQGDGDIRQMDAKDHTIEPTGPVIHADEDEGKLTVLDARSIAGRLLRNQFDIHQQQVNRILNAIQERGGFTAGMTTEDVDNLVSSIAQGVRKTGS